MEHPSILDRSSASPAVEGAMPGGSALRSTNASVSAGIAAANAQLPKPEDPGPRFPGEDGGRSLVDIAHSDLDAALQLLAERAQYITEASGAAIALRRGQHNDMLCRASAGSNAPELGSLLSMEYGLSGESVRTRQALRCDDAERDPRVNREGCRQLGIASVVVMPIVSEQQVLGVFELFSGKPRAFEERDISALQRLSEMVETAVKHAVVPIVPEVEELADAGSQAPSDAIVIEAAPVETAPVETPVEMKLPDVVQTLPVNPPPEPEKAEAQPEPAAKKPLFWSAAMQTQANTGRANEAAASVSVPPGLRNLQKCQACGFPVSQGRTFCVECEEKKWRGQRLSKPAAGVATTPLDASAPTEPAAGVVRASESSSVNTPNPPANLSGRQDSALFLSSTAPAESWIASNKYILGALLIVAIVIGAIVWLR
jgi:GAF domain